MSLPPPRPHIEEVLNVETHGTANIGSVLSAVNTRISSPWTKAAQAALLKAAAKNNAVNAPPAVSQPLRTKRKRRSCVWQFFTKHEAGGGKLTVKCNADGCHWKSVYQRGSTTNMRNHLLSDHSQSVFVFDLFSFIFM